MLNFFSSLDLHTSMMLILGLIFVSFYEAINGFHDTANAVATVIYTKALCSHFALIISGIFNFLGVLMSGLSVAYAIIHLLPNNILLNISSNYGLAMIFAILISAILWNLGTWYFCLPSSSSHTLIGAIIGIALINSIINKNSIYKALNIHKLIEIIISLIISPIFGLILSGLIIYIIRFYLKNIKKNNVVIFLIKKEKKNKPSFSTRLALILSAAGVSFSHGANDGQKGIGLMMLILIIFLPASFILNMNSNQLDINKTSYAINNFKYFYIKYYNKNNLNKNNDQLNNSFYKNIIKNNNFNITNKNLSKNNFIEIKNTYCNQFQILNSINKVFFLLRNINNYNELNLNQRFYVHNVIICITDVLDNILKIPELSNNDKIFLYKTRKDLLKTIEYAPVWAIFIIALSLSIGTMIGWKRVTKTIGKGIGSKKITPLQGMTAQITTAISIGIASYTGTPVSTTHVLTSAITGSILIDGESLKLTTIKNIIIAWILTLPISIFLSSILYLFFLNFI